MIKHFFLIFLFILILSCDLSSPKEINDSKLTDIFDDIKIAFSMLDITEIMDHYSNDFLHNGNDYDDEYQKWDSRMNNFTNIQFSDIDIEYVQDEYAEVSFVLKLSNSDESYTWDEPSLDNGDLSYFREINGDWKVYGNQLD